MSAPGRPRERSGPGFVVWQAGRRAASEQQLDHVWQVAAGGPGERGRTVVVIVAANAPERAVPECQIDRLEACGGIAAGGAGSRTMHGMDVSATIEQKPDHLAMTKRIPLDVAEVVDKTLWDRAIDHAGNLVPGQGDALRIPDFI